MQILLVAATPYEIDPLIKRYDAHLSDDGLPRLNLAQCEVDCLITGIGMVATSFALTSVLSQHTYDLVINAGIGGCFGSNYEIGEVLEVRSEVFADFGVDDKGLFRTPTALGWKTFSSYPFSDGGIQNTESFDYLNHLRKAKGATVNTASGSSNRIEQIINTFNPDIESMEGAAVFYVAQKLGVSFFELRAISNRVEPRNLNNWNISLAIANLNSTLIGIFEGF